MGIAVINTRDITYESFFVSPFIAPAVAIAADTPQIETALDIIIDSSSSIFNFLHNQKAKYQTLSTTTNACIKPNEPARRISEKIIPVPKRTKPIFTYNSVANDDLNHSGNLKTLLTKSPNPRLKITASRFKSLTPLLPARMSANTVNR